MDIGDGLDCFRNVCLEMDFNPLPLIVRTARWVDPDTYDVLPVWYPEKARKMPMYQKGWITRQLNKDEARSETNECANKALKKAGFLKSEQLDRLPYLGN